MKSQTFRRLMSCITGTSRGALSLAAIAACSFSPQKAAAQPYPHNSMLYRFFDPTPNSPTTDIRAVGTTIVHGGGSNNREAITVGNIYTKVDVNTSSWGNGMPFFVRFSDFGGTGNFNGNLIDYPEIDPGNTFPSNAKFYSNPTFYDMAAVDIVPGDAANDEYYITCRARQSSFNNPAAQDQIQILQVNGNGSLTNQWTINDIQFTGNTWGYSMYPVHTLFRKNVPDPNTSNPPKDLLYISGFVTYANTTSHGAQTALFNFPNTNFFPDFVGEKRAFVIAVDMSAGNQGNIHAVKYYDNVFTSTNPLDAEFDYDMAMRMTNIPTTHGANRAAGHLSKNYAGHIHVTGSTNAKTGSSNGISGTIIRSATMNMVIDKWTLNIVSQQHFISQGNGDGYGSSEYGVGYVEGDNNGDDNYIVSNTYSGMTNPNVTGYDPLAPPNAPGPNSTVAYTSGFNAKPDKMTITRLSPELTATSTAFQQTRQKANIGWAQQVLPTVTTANGLAVNLQANTRFLIAGMMHTDPTNTVIPAPSIDNINTFICDVHATYSQWAAPPATPGVLTVDEISTFEGGGGCRVYPTLLGTGTTGITPPNWDNYINVGNDVSGLLFNTLFADRYSTTDQVVFASPKKDKTYPAAPTTPIVHYLGMKEHYADNATLESGICQYEIDPSFTAENIEVTSTLTEIIPDIAIVPSGSVEQDMGYEHGGDCMDASGYRPGTILYKTSSTGIIVRNAQSDKTIIYPNPASTSINIGLPKSVDNSATVKVVLTSLHGQVVGELYNGSAEKLTGSTQLQLPNVAAGLYFVHVYSNGAMIHQQKLNIQQ